MNGAYQPELPDTSRSTFGLINLGSSCVNIVLNDDKPTRTGFRIIPYGNPLSAMDEEIQEQGKT
jgi:hypothetical protein